MGISKTPEVAPFPFGAVDQGTANRYEALPTPTSMRSKSLFGIPLRSSLTGETVPDATLQSYINTAISEIEHELDLYITPVQFSERHDYSQEMQFHSWGYLKLNHSPILNVDKFQIVLNNGNTNIAPMVDIPLEFIHVQPQDGTVQLVPATGVTVSGYIASLYSGMGYHAFLSGTINQWPGAITVQYTAGFQQDKVPALLVGLIENIAAYKFLSSLGPILFPYNSVGISVDGTSQSTGTMGPAFLQQRMGELEKIIATQKEAAKGYYQKRFLIDYL